VRFNIIFFITGVALLLIVALFDVNYLTNKAPVPFSQWKTISFYDFNGLKRPGYTINGVTEFAYIETNRKIEYTGNGIIRITAYFYPSRSYVFDEHIRNPDLLKHEIYHFYITEYFTRLLRREIKAFNGTVTRHIINGLNKKYIRFEDEMQKLYDEETYHSYIMQFQKKWEKSLDDELLSLYDFSNPDVSLKN